MRVSVVRSLKLDQLDSETLAFMTQSRNDKCNAFFAATLPPAEALQPDATQDERVAFAKRKYIERAWAKDGEPTQLFERYAPNVAVAAPAPEAQSPTSRRKMVKRRVKTLRSSNHGGQRRTHSTNATSSRK